MRIFERTQTEPFGHSQPPLGVVGQLLFLDRLCLKTAHFGRVCLFNMKRHPSYYVSKMESKITKSFQLMFDIKILCK